MPMVNLDLGPCIITWDELDANVSYTKTFGGVIFRYEELRQGIKEDQAGLTDVSEVTTGVTNPELTAPLTREEIAILDNVFQNSDLGAAYLRVKNPVATDMLPYCRRVVVKPIINGVVSTDATTWIYIHRAFPRVAMEQTYDNAGQRVVNVVFKGFPDDESGRQGALWDYGRK